jgi:hypothetical protein
MDQSSLSSMGYLDLSMPSFQFLYSARFWQYVFLILWVHRYFRLLVHCVSHWAYKSKPIPAKPSFTSKDVTVVIPTIHNAFEELRPSLESIMACNPAELILVTTADKMRSLQYLADSMGRKNIRVLFTPIANKRLQGLLTLKGATLKFRQPTTWMGVHLACLDAPAPIGLKFFRATNSSTDLEMRNGETGS